MLARTRWCGQAIWIIAIHWLVAASIAPLQAQSIDIDPPVIELERVDTGQRGEAQVFSATVTDNVGVTSTTLHYRTATEGAYESVPMNPIGRSDIRTASVPAAMTDVPLIQYYVEARDEGGNRTIRGFAFDPLERRLEPVPGVPPTAPAGNEPVADTGMSTSRKILYGALGVLAVGALIAAAGGDDDDSPSGPGPTDIPVTVTVEPLAIP